MIDPQDVADGNWIADVRRLARDHGIDLGEDYARNLLSAAQSVAWAEARALDPPAKMVQMLVRYRDREIDLALGSRTPERLPETLFGRPIVVREDGS